MIGTTLSGRYQIHDIGQHEGGLYLVMPLLPGRTLLGKAAADDPTGPAGGDKPWSRNAVAGGRARG